jgi:ribosomal protein S18 acetylase RimI-like enzyme
VPRDRRVRRKTRHIGAWFERAHAAETGRPGYNPRDLLKLYLYGYLNQIRSSRRLEPEYANVGCDIDELSIVVHRLAVDPAFRGKGIEAALMLQAENIARERGVKVLRVDSNGQNQATQRLFPKLGYSFASEIQLGFRPGLSFLCYEKRFDLKS